jgi:hypothetical protein
MSRVTYAYDEGSFGDDSLQQSITPVRHNGTNYGSTFVASRGNLTSTTRWNVDYPTNSSYAITSSTKYNTAGSPVAKISPWEGTNTRTIRIGYADNFNSTVGVSTYAYPTVIVDPAGTSLSDTSHLSTAKYRYDIGVSVEANSPAPAGNSHGKKTQRVYDSAGRLERDSVYINTIEHAYTRYEYPTNGIQSKVYSTIVDRDSDGADADDEVLSETFTDGAGRTRLSRVPHTFSSGTTVTWAGTITEFDILGRVKRQSVPTEVNSSWAATGDDATRGFLWTYQKYDWMNRVVRKINTDGVDQTTLNDSDILISYDGCGCAGGVVTTIESELVPRTDTSGNARRKQKVYEDIQGRSFESETYEWDGSTVYSTVVNSYNGRDQVIQSRQYAGTTTSETFQDKTATFDGHGRLASSHRPEQRDSSDNLKYTTYSYNLDDSVANVTDGRGAVTNYAYNSRGLVENISWTVPGTSGILDPADVGFAYDNLGNRTSMTDGLGEVDYEYNELSQMTAETRDFTDTLSGAPTGGVFRLEYTYNLSGGLKSLKDPYGQQFNYVHDKTGRLQSVTGLAAWNGVSQYATNAQYNARGTLVGLAYGNGTEMLVTGFNDKLQATNFEVKKGTTPYIKKEYQFYNDGSLKFSEDLIDETFDRLYKYDHGGRTTLAKAGTAARGESPTGPHNFDQPYTMAYSHDAFGHISGSNGYYYGAADSTSYTYENNRQPLWVYDEEGDVQYDYDASFETDAAGNVAVTTVGEFPATASFFDGAGGLVKRTVNFGSTDPAPETSYFIRSSVLNKVITETTATGGKLKTFVPANGTTLAEQLWESFSSTEILRFIHQDASASSTQLTTAGGDLVSGSGRTGEYDAIGRNVADASPYITVDTEILAPVGGIDLFGSGEGYRPGHQVYRIDGQVVSASYFMETINSGAIGGAFGLLMISARMSAPRLLRHYVRGSDGLEMFQNNAQGFREAMRTETRNPTWVRVWGVSDAGWAVGELLSAVGQGNQQAQTDDVKRLPKSLFDKKRKHTDKPGLERDFRSKLSTDNGNGTCLEKLNELLKELNSSYSSIETLASKFFDGGFSLYETTRPISQLRQKEGKTWAAVSAPSGATAFNGASMEMVLNTYHKNQAFTFIHELLHAAGTGQTFEHPEITAAIQRLEKRGDIGINNFIGMYCEKKEGR